MKNYILNPIATSLELNIDVGIDVLQTQGWDFDTYHESRAEVQGITKEQAERDNIQEYTAVLTVRTNEDGELETFDAWYNYDSNETTCREHTGDDEETIRDVVSLLNEGVIVIDDGKDLSRDSEGNYVPSFIECSALFTKLYSI